MSDGLNQQLWKFRLCLFKKGATLISSGANCERIGQNFPCVDESKQSQLTKHGCDHSETLGTFSLSIVPRWFFHSVSLSYSQERRWILVYGWLFCVVCRVMSVLKEPFQQLEASSVMVFSFLIKLFQFISSVFWTQEVFTNKQKKKKTDCNRGLFITTGYLVIPWVILFFSSKICRKPSCCIILFVLWLPPRAGYMIALCEMGVWVSTTDTGLEVLLNALA